MPSCATFVHGAVSAKNAKPKPVSRVAGGTSSGDGPDRQTPAHRHRHHLTELKRVKEDRASKKAARFAAHLNTEMLKYSTQALEKTCTYGASGGMTQPRGSSRSTAHVTRARECHGSRRAAVGARARPRRSPDRRATARRAGSRGGPPVTTCRV